MLLNDSMPLAAGRLIKLPLKCFHNIPSVRNEMLKCWFKCIMCDFTPRVFPSITKCDFSAFHQYSFSIWDFPFLLLSVFPDYFLPLLSSANWHVEKCKLSHWKVLNKHWHIFFCVFRFWPGLRRGRKPSQPLWSLLLSYSFS